MVSKKEYAKIVQQHSGKSPVLKDTAYAFLFGGAICTIGEGLINFYKWMGIEAEKAGTFSSITLIIAASVLTAFSVFDKIAKIAGAGTLVPITGFSNAVTSPAMEFRTEGLITGTAAKMFDVAGPVIVFGTTSSVIAGILYLIFVK